MRKGIVILSLTGLIGLTVACSSKKPAATTAAPLTKEVALKQYSTAQIAEGETLFNAKCGTCHKLHKPSQFADVRWNNIMDRMIPKAKATVEEGKLMRAYAIANARDPK